MISMAQSYDTSHIWRNEWNDYNRPIYHVQPYEVPDVAAMKRQIEALENRVEELIMRLEELEAKYE